MHDDDEFKKQKAEIDQARRILDEAERQMPGSVQSTMRQKVKSMVSDTLEEMRSSKHEIRAFIERGVSEMDYAELKRLHGYAFLLFVHALSTEWE